MSFPNVPTESKKQIQAAGKTLASDRSSIGAAEHARVLLSNWRACHLFPLHVFAEELQTRLTKLQIDAIVAYRLKRLFRIVEKLKMFTNMNATTMQDIAGLRAIAPDMDAVRRIITDYTGSPSKISTSTETTDYIASPKESGYRSIHLTFRYKGSQASPFDGLRIELQLRSYLQHLWATAVEATGMWHGQRIKYDEGDPAWAEFFSLTAELLAHREGTPASTKYAGMNVEDLRDQLRSNESELGALVALRKHANTTPAVVMTNNVTANQSGSFLLLQLDQTREHLNIRSFDQDIQDQALLAYAEAEQRVTFTDGALAPVLVSVNVATRLQDAYRSFYLDVTEFVEIVEDFIRE